MKVTFLGTGCALVLKRYNTCFLMEEGDRKLLVDAGGGNGVLPILRDLHIPLTGIHHVIVTHAHIDHSGRLPLLVKRGYLGSIVATRLTGELLGIMLRDSAHIQESDAEYQNRKGKRHLVSHQKYPRFSCYRTDKGRYAPRPYARAGGDTRGPSFKGGGFPSGPGGLYRGQACQKAGGLAPRNGCL